MSIMRRRMTKYTIYLFCKEYLPYACLFRCISAKNWSHIFSQKDAFVLASKKDISSARRSIDRLYFGQF